MFYWAAEPAIPRPTVNLAMKQAKRLNSKKP
jgi:hypothetical protein